MNTVSLVPLTGLLVLSLGSHDNIYDICSSDDYSIKSMIGVIRSHSGYPWTYDGMHRTCRRTLKPRSGHILSLTLDDLDTSDSDYLTIRHAKVNSDDILQFDVKMSSRKHWFITDGFIEIKFTATSGVKSASGFILQFEQLLNNSVPLPRVNHNPSDVDNHKTSFFSNTHFRHHMATVDECITSKEKRTSLHCPSDHVIYKPELQVGVSNVRKCMRTEGDCMGMTHTLLTQRNKCYWRNSCELSWRSGIPITLSTTPTCLALPPDYLSLSGFSCIAKDQVFDICDKRVSTVNVTNGLIISHQYYPWHYDSKKTVCRKRIQIHRKLGLRMSSDDFDLDPDSRKDNVKIFIVSEDGKRRPLKKFMRNQNVNLSFTEGCVDVEFRVDEHSKSGRGFVFKLQPAFPGTDVDSDDGFYTCPGFKKRRNKHHRRKTSRTRKHRRTFMKSRRKTHRRRNKPRKGRNGRRGRRYRNNKFNEIHTIY
ncbi:uncharacterized protein LOC121383194 isoform X2 [Gigantopelta aegis]|uniref:uncharacterized protein LOC121383194 isoform X2 n=1 Tax=Gigantopelta aegis TaxID=1735272 RepID=UPI001B88807F|nr:uncharacterized protein LOC121383194 isoform X2 [Gigantopelta aegis]